MESYAFEEQYNTYMNYGYAVDPTGNGYHVGDSSHFDRMQGTQSEGMVEILTDLLD